jgi:hypothetical protein
MAVFDPNSRYVRFASVYTATDRRGRQVQALTAALVPPQTRLGEHLRRDGQRLDHLANFYLGDPNGFWRIAEINDAVLPDALALVRAMTIPTQR